MYMNQAGPDTLMTALERASQELASISDHVGKLQHALPEAIAEMTPNLLGELQALDYIHQHIDELRIYIDAIGAMSDENWTIDITNATMQVRLGLMVERLRGLAAPNSAPQEDAGELQLLWSHGG